MTALTRPIEPIELRAAYASIDEATKQEKRRQLWSEISAPLMRVVAGRTIIGDPKGSAEDFDVALHLLMLDEAARRVRRDAERRANEEEAQRIHTCRLCGDVDASANNSALASGGGVPGSWCQRCRTEWARQATADHAARKVGDRTVAELVAEARKAAAP